MDPGKLREAVDIYRPVEARNSRGEPIMTFTPWESDVPASVKGLSGKQLQIARAAGTQATYDVRLRADGMEDLSERDRLYWRHAGRFRILEIESIINIGARDRELIVMCTEIVGKTDITVA